MAKKAAAMDLDPTHSGIKERDGYATSAPNHEGFETPEDETSAKPIGAIEGEAQTPAQKTADEVVIEAQEVAAGDLFWQRAKAIWTALEADMQAYIFVRPVQASHSKRINPHTYVVGVKNENGLLTKEAVQDFLDNHDGGVKVTNLVGYVARDENDQPFPGAEVYFELT